jgi:hypothetical protein
LLAPERERLRDKLFDGLLYFVSAIAELFALRSDLFADLAYAFDELRWKALRHSSLPIPRVFDLVNRVSGSPKPDIDRARPDIP